MSILTADEQVSAGVPPSGIARHYAFTPFAASGDVGVAINVLRHTRVTVQGVGTWTGTLTLIAEGSLVDAIPTANADFFPLTNGLGTAIEFTGASGGMLVGENVKWIRLRATAGSGSATVTGYILAVV